MHGKLRAEVEERNKQLQSMNLKLERRLFKVEQETTQTQLEVVELKKTVKRLLEKLAE